MMCSSWKISVFGILALMLAFGMTTDTLAAPVKADVVLGNIGTPPNAPLRAVDETTTDADHITFTVTASVAGDAAGEVRITIPSGWYRPFNINGDGDDADTTVTVADLNEHGEVYIVDSANDASGDNPGGAADDTGDASFRGSISGSTLVARFGKAVTTSAVVFTYKSKHPVRASTYAFPVSGDHTETGLVTTTGNGLKKRGGSYFYDVVVGPVASGKGEFTVTGISAYKHPDVEPKSEKDKYFLTSKQSLSGLTFTFKAVGTMLKDSRISIDAGTGGWSGFFPGPGGPDAGRSTVTGAGEFLTGTDGSTTTKLVVKITAARLEANQTISIRIDGLEAPEVKEANPFSVRAFTPGTTSFVVDTSSSDTEALHTAFTFVTTSAHGSGTIGLSTTDVTGSDPATVGRALTYAASEETLGNLEFELAQLNGFANSGKIEIEIPAGFTPAPYKTFTGTGAGTVTVDAADFQTGDNAPALSLTGRKATITLKPTVPAAPAPTDPAVTPTVEDGGTVVYNGDIKAPKAQGLYTFTTMTQTGPHGALTAVGSSPMVEVVAAHGSGTMALTNNGAPFSRTTSEAAPGNLVFTYTPGGRMAKGAQVQVVLPAGWSRARVDSGDGTPDAGEITLSGKATLIVAGDGASFTATTTESLTAADRLMFTYKAVKVPKHDTPVSHTFVTRATSHSGGTLATSEIKASPSVGIGRAPDGSGSIALSKTQADAGSSIGDLMITYTAAGKMTSGATVEITIPETGGWPAPSIDVSVPGGVTLGGSISGIIPVVTATTMSATITTDLSAGHTIIFTYKGLTAPTVGGQYTFTAKSTSAAFGTLTPLSEPKSIQIDEVAAGRVMIAGADGMMLSSAAPEMALGNLTFTFTAGAAMATGAQVQITIPAGWTPPFLENGGTDDPGESDVSGNHSLSVSGGVLTATTTSALAIDDTLTITYKMVTAPTTEATYQFLTKSSVASGGTLLPVSSQPSVIVRTPVASIDVSAMPESVFAGDDVTVTVDLMSAAGEAAKSLGSTVVMLSDGDAGGTFSDADGNAVTSVTIADNTSSASATYVNTTAGMVTITATSGEMTATAAVEVKSTIRGLSVDNELVQQGSTIMVSAIGQAGGGTVTILDADGDKVGTKKALDPVDDPDADGDQEYQRSITLPATLADGMYTVSVEIQGDVNNELQIEVVNDQTPPSVSNAASSMDVVAAGDTITLSADVAMNESMVDIDSVMADLGGLDTTQAMVGMDELSSTPGRYFTVITIASMDDGNTAEDGEYTITITATDAIGNAGMDTTTVMLRNDTTPPVLSDAAITPDWALNGDTVTISVNGGESGLTVTADASAIGGAADEMLTEGMDDDMMGTGMYSVDVEVMDADGGDQMVEISATDMGGNTTTASASVSIHMVTSASFAPSEVSSGDTVMVSAMGTAGLTGTFSVFDADGNNIVEEKSLTEDAMNAGSYSGSVDVTVAHPPGEYWVSATIGQASMTAEGALTIEHSAEFTLAIGAGTHLIHVPLNVTHIDGVEGTIDTVGDLYDALGDAVNFIISLGADGSWNSYLGDASAGGAADAAIGDDTGLIAVMSSAASLTLSGEGLGTGGASAINLNAGNNLVGVPLDPVAGLDMISDALAHPAVSAIVVSNAAGNGFNTVAQAGDPGDGAVMGGVGYIVVAAAPASIPVIGMAWDNSMADMSGGMTATAPSIGFQTPVLQVQGKLIDEAGMMSLDGLNVTVRNVTRGTTLGSTMAADDYSMTFVKLDSSAAKVGDVLEIKADSPNPLLGIRPVQHVVTADDVRDSRIDLPDLVTYEIPAQSELLANYPNPFNPETWIPFRLAEDSNVSLSIYGASGSLVRTIDIGFTPAAVYEGRSDAIYWDGRNDFGEQVSSGLYFYHLSAGEFSATRRMVIVK